MEQTKKSSKVGLIAAIALLVVSIGLLFIMVAVGPLADNGAGFGLLAGIGQYFAAFITDPGLTGTGKVWFAANQSFGGFIGV
ncbi:MAG: hypothetical protein HUJ60_01265, partial [Bacilli bacterium]|nr:hypothetical protein [Bacilli bacterium]